MSKGNMLLGYARGKVGDVVFSRLKGQQITKARNRKPNNPRTNSQMTQRALFISAVKFYQLCIANFYRFAFEDKAPHESDYNAFMRYNVKQGSYLSKAAFDNRNYPAIGDWVLSRGTLGGFRQYSYNNGFAFDTGVDISFAPDSDANVLTTVGTLSEVILKDVRFQPGDMFTYVRYGVYGTGVSSIPDVNPSDDAYNSYFDYKQFILDPNDDTALSKYGLHPDEDFEGLNHIVLYSDSDIFDERFECATMIITRNTTEGIRTSNSQLIMSPLYTNALAQSRSKVYLDQVLEAWRANPDAILDPLSLKSNDRPTVYSWYRASQYPIKVNPGQDTPIIANISPVPTIGKDTIQLSINGTTYDIAFFPGTPIGNDASLVIDTDSVTDKPTGNISIELTSSATAYDITALSLGINGTDAIYLGVKK